MKKISVRMLKNLILVAVLTVGSIALFTNTAFAANKAIDLANITSQVFAKNQAVEAFTPTVNITDDDTAATITAANDIRVIIPAGATNTVFDSTDTSITITSAAFAKVLQEAGGAACAASPCTVTVTYEGSDKVMIIPVGTDFATSDAIAISTATMTFKTFDTAYSAQGLALSVDGDATADADCGGGAVACNTQTLTAGENFSVSETTMASAANQAFAKNQASTAMSAITITTDATNAFINSTDDIRITIPSGSNFVWDTGDLEASISGTGYDHIEQTAGGAACAADPCAVTVTLEDSSRTLVIPVDATLTAGDTVVVSGLSYTTFSAAAANDNLDLEVANDGTVTVTDSMTVGVGAPTIASAANQAFAKNQDSTAISAITITDDASVPVINTTDDIRITIPSGSNFIWDTSDTAAVITGTDLAKVGAGDGTATVTYEDSNRTVIIPIATNFGASGVFTVSGLNFTTFSAAAANDNLDLDVANTSGVTATDSTTIGVGAPTIASAASQIFVKNQASTAISTITITDDASVPVINTTDDIKITIPSGSNFIWDSSDTTATIGGADAAKVSATVSYEDTNRTLIVNVTTNFGAGGVVTVSGLSFKTFSAAAASDNLDLDVANGTGVTATDSTTIIQGAPTIASSSSQTFYTGMSSQVINWTMTITESATAPGINTTDDIIIRIPTAFNMQFDPTDTTVVVAGTDWAKVETTEGGAACGATSCAVTVVIKQADASTACTGASGSLCKTLRIPVDSNWDASDTITVTGATLFEFSSESDADNLELEAAGAAYGSSATDEDSATVTILVATTAGGSDHTGPSMATDFKAEVDENNHVVLTWTDPTSADLKSISVLKGVGDLPVSGTPIATVEKGVKTYTDTNVSAGDTVKYIIRGIDNAGNSGTNTETLTITVEEGETAESVTTDVDTTTDTDTDTTTDDTSGATPEEEVVTPATATVTFSDVEGHWAEVKVEAMSEKGIIEGKSEGEFAPNGNLNRAEASAMLFRVFGQPEPTSAPEAKSFDDVALDSWYASYVDYLKGLGLVSGKTATKYAPAENINRAEFVAMAMKTYHYLTGTETPADQVVTTTFTDKLPTWAEKTISEAVDLGFISGSVKDEKTYFYPSAQISRAEAATVLYNMFYSMLP